MNRLRLIARSCALGIAAAFFCLAFSGCVYDFPITAEPTRKIDDAFLGDWSLKDGSGHGKELQLRRLDDLVYIGSYDGMLFRAYHSDVAKTPFVSIQDLDSGDRKYAYMTWTVSDDGKLLTVKGVDKQVIPTTSMDSAGVQRLLAKNLQNPALFERDILQFTRVRKVEAQK